MSALSVLAWLVSLAASCFLLLAVLAAVWFLDRYDREPLHLVALVFAWGAVAAPLLAVRFGIQLNVLMAVVGAEAYLPSMLLPVVSAPLVEEALKGAAVLGVILLSRHFDNPTDGIVYGTAAGLGFAMTENAIYGASSALSGPASQVVAVLAVRTLFSSGVHALASAAFGGLAAWIQLIRGRFARLAWGLMAYGVAVALHAGWNLAVVRAEGDGSPLALQSWLLALPLLYLVYLAVLALLVGGEHRVLRRELAEEVELGVLPEWVPRILPYYRRRVRSDWWPSLSERRVICRLLTRLAFRKHQLRRLPAEASRIAAVEVMQLRSRARRMLVPAADPGDDSSAA